MPERRAARRHRLLAAASGLLLLGLGVRSIGTIPAEGLVGFGRSAGTSRESRDKDDKRAFVVSGDVTGLAPGVPRPLVLTLANPNNFAIRVTALSVTVGAPPGSPACSPSYLAVSSFAGPLHVARNATASTTLTATLSRAAPDACQLRRFPLTYGGTAVKP